MPFIYLFIYSPKGNVAVNVKRDNAFLKEVIPKCEFFYFKYYLPALYSMDTSTNCENYCDKNNKQHSSTLNSVQRSFTGVDVSNMSNLK